MSDIEEMQALVEKIEALIQEGYGIDSDPGGYVSGCLGHLQQAADCLEVFAIPRLEQKAP